MKNSVIAIHFYVITPLIVYALLAPIFFETDNNAFGEVGGIFVVNNDKTTTMYSQQQEMVVETKECKSSCPSTEEICIEVCA